MDEHIKQLELSGLVILAHLWQVKKLSTEQKRLVNALEDVVENIDEIRGILGDEAAHGTVLNILSAQETEKGLILIVSK